MMLPTPLNPIDAQAASDCRSCHGSYRQIGVSIEANDVFAQGVANQVYWTMSGPWKNDWIEAKVSWSATNTTELNGEFIPWQGTLAGGNSISGSFEVTPEAIGDIVEIDFTLETVAFYDHTKASRPDRQTETVTLRISIPVEKLDLMFDNSYYVMTQDGIYDTNLSNHGGETINQMTIKTDEGTASFGSMFEIANPDVKHEFLNTLEPGWAVEIHYEGPAPTTRWNVITVEGVDGNGKQVSSKLTITKTAANLQFPVPPLAASTGILYGWVATGSLVAIMAHGFFKRRLDGKFRDARRESKKEKMEWEKETPKERATYWWWLHYSLMFATLFFVGIHILGLGMAEAMPMLSTELWFGIIATLLIGITGISGLYPKLSMKLIPKLSFRRGHALLGILACLLTLFHILLFI